MSTDGRDERDRPAGSLPPPPPAAERGPRSSTTARPPGAAEHAADHGAPGASRRWTRGDTARVVVAALTLATCWVVASSGVPAVERDAFAAVNDGPDWLHPVVWPVMQLGNLAVAVGVAIAVGVAVRKPRLGLLVATSAVLAWLSAKVVKALVQRGRPGPEGLDVALRGPMETGFGFVSGHTAVAFAVAAVAAPHLRRPWNRVVLAAAAVVGLARIYVGVHLPLDVVGGAACGLLVGEVVRVMELRTRTRGGASRDAVR